MYTFNFNVSDDSRFSVDDMSDFVHSMDQFPVVRELSDRLEYNNSVQWATVMKNFAVFLGAFYGYSILDKVAFADADEDGDFDFTLFADSDV